MAFYFLIRCLFHTYTIGILDKARFTCTCAINIRPIFAFYIAVCTNGLVPIYAAAHFVCAFAITGFAGAIVH